MIALTEELLATAKQNEISLSDAGVSAGATAGSPDLESAWENMVGLFCRLFTFRYYFRFFLAPSLSLSLSIILPQMLPCDFFVNLNTETHALCKPRSMLLQSLLHIYFGD